MNPYSRFRLVSNMATAALLAGSLCAGWPVASALLAAETGGATPAYQAAVAGIAAALVLVSLAVSYAILPALFQMAFLRRMVLGRHYVEGTWLQAERGPSGTERLTVLHVRPAGAGFAVSGYCLNQECEIESNRMVEYAKLDGPVLTYAYRSLMPDGAGNQARGMSELMFEPRRGAPKTYSGYGEPWGARRFQVEGVKLTKGSERRRLRKLEQRADIVEKYWALFFGGGAPEAAEDTPPVVARPADRRPVIVPAAKPAAAFTDRRDPASAPDDDGPVITRRRASDWRSEDATPTADRIRARMMQEADLAEDDEEILDEEDAYAADADDTAYEDEDEDAGHIDAGYDEDEDYDAEDETGLDADEDDVEFDAAEDEEDEYEADAEDDDDDADAEEAEPVMAEDDDAPRIRQRYARRR